VNEVIRAAAALQAVCLAEGWRFCFIGGLAVQRWGEPRETVDVDLTLLTGFDGEARFVSLLIERFEPRMALLTARGGGNVRRCGDPAVARASVALTTARPTRT
jgi:hypothetical protein